MAVFLAQDAELLQRSAAKMQYRELCWEVRIRKCEKEIRIARLQKYSINFNFLRFKSETWWPIKGCPSKPMVWTNVQQVQSFWEASALENKCCMLCLHTPTSSNTFWMCQTCCIEKEWYTACASIKSSLLWAWWTYVSAAHLHKIWCFLSKTESLGLYHTANPKSCSDQIWHFCMSVNLVKVSGTKIHPRKQKIMSGLSLEFHEILLLSIQYQTKKPSQNSERWSTPVSRK